MVRLPFGQRKVKFSDGRNVQVAAVMRRQRNIAIIEAYLKDLEDNKRPKSYKLAKSTLYLILDVCSASPRKSLTCIDYFIGDAYQVHKILKTISMNVYYFI